MPRLYEPRNVFSMINKNKLKKKSLRTPQLIWLLPSGTQSWHTVNLCKWYLLYRLLIHKTHTPEALRCHPLKLQTSRYSSVRYSMKTKLL